MIGTGAGTSRKEDGVHLGPQEEDVYIGAIGRVESKGNQRGIIRGQTLRPARKLLLILGRGDKE